MSAVMVPGSAWPVRSCLQHGLRVAVGERDGDDWRMLAS